MPHHRVSLSTALQARCSLEEEGLLEPAALGYFVLAPRRVLQLCRGPSPAPRRLRQIRRRIRASTTASRISW